MSQNGSLITNRGADSLDDNAVQELLVLAERIRRQSGGELDEDAILAVAEASGAPVEYVRLAVRAAPVRQKRSLWQRMKAQYLGFDPEMRASVAGGIIGSFLGLVEAVTTFVGGDRTGLAGVLGFLGVLAAVWVCVQAPSRRAAAIAGGLVGGVYVVAGAVIQTVLSIWREMDYTSWGLMFVLVPLGAVVGIISHITAETHFRKRGPAKQDRQQLLQQLLDLQAQIAQDERVVTFLSVDIVGSTRMKQGADPVAIEFTFTEYHKFVETITERHGGRVHNTAGDGVTCVFDQVDDAVAAGRALLAGLFEFNAFRNRLGTEVQVRAGIHSGTVLAAGQDVTKVNFAEVIDVAAHLQKDAPPGTLAVSEAAASTLLGGARVLGTERIDCHGVSARVWRPRARVAPEQIQPLN